MPDTISRQDATAREFAELICADPAWLRAEFEAIVSAGFGDVPALPPVPANDSRPLDPGKTAAARRVAASVWRAWPPEHRERAPPPPSEDTKAVTSLGR
ncbi:hypothetical protein CU254_21585 [Amycolatopsis sp. AA4]|uniref:hypothetical protein n=1 Tax=Actinomycetes TaxID=1760 RepID=UPI0001B57057|nr:MULTISPECIES: hypothetical protein [Actinomycetes]ATY12760.1 hypothetical protein CU254_21585 [Amycolatopsis sp. AA4]EFL08579.1 predicted protein [Streptomyces sp. AA4]